MFLCVTGQRLSLAVKLSLSFHKKTTDAVIISRHSHPLKMLRNHSDTTFMTLQVTNKGFKGIASNSHHSVTDSEKIKGEGHSRLLLQARIFLELTHLNSLENLRAQVHLDGCKCQTACVIIYIKLLLNHKLKPVSKLIFHVQFDGGWGWGLQTTQSLNLWMGENVGKENTYDWVFSAILILLWGKKKS